MQLATRRSCISSYSGPFVLKSHHRNVVYRTLFGFLIGSTSTHAPLFGYPPVAPPPPWCVVTDLWGVPPLGNIKSYWLRRKFRFNDFWGQKSVFGSKNRFFSIFLKISSFFFQFWAKKSIFFDYWPKEIIFCPKRLIFSDFRPKKTQNSQKWLKKHSKINVRTLKRVDNDGEKTFKSHVDLHKSA